MERCYYILDNSCNYYNIYYGNFWIDSGIQIIDEMVSSGRKLPEAIICANDYMAIGVSEALSKAGIRIPEDIAIAGFDYSEEGSTSPVPITSVMMPYFSYGQYAEKCVEGLLDGVDIPSYEVDGDLFILFTAIGREYKSLKRLIAILTKYSEEGVFKMPQSFWFRLCALIQGRKARKSNVLHLLHLTKEENEFYGRENDLCTEISK